MDASWLVHFTAFLVTCSCLLQITEVYQIKRVPKVVAERRVTLVTCWHCSVVRCDACSVQKWKKFGEAVEDGPGVNKSTTQVADEVYLTLTSNREVRMCWHILAYISCSISSLASPVDP